MGEDSSPRSFSHRIGGHHGSGVTPPTASMSEPSLGSGHWQTQVTTLELSARIRGEGGNGPAPPRRDNTNTNDDKRS